MIKAHSILTFLVTLCKYCINFYLLMLLEPAVDCSPQIRKCGLVPRNGASVCRKDGGCNRLQSLLMLQGNKPLLRSSVFAFLGSYSLSYVCIPGRPILKVNWILCDQESNNICCKFLCSWIERCVRSICIRFRRRVFYSRAPNRWLFLEPVNLIGSNRILFV